MRLRFILSATAWLVSSVAFAEVDGTQVAAAKAAAEQFAALSKDTKTTGVAPRVSEPAVGSLFERVFRTSDVRSPVFADLGPLTERMAAGARVGQVYLLAGTGADDIARLPNDRSASRTMNLNIIRYEPEMGRFFDFQMFMQGAMIDALARPVAGAARVQLAARLRDVRAASKTIASGLIENFAINGLSDTWRRQRLVALLANAPRYARFLDAAQKSELKAVAIACAESMDDAAVKRGLERFASMVSGAGGR